MINTRDFDLKSIKQDAIAAGIPFTDMDAALLTRALYHNEQLRNTPDSQLRYYNLPTGDKSPKPQLMIGWEVELMFNTDPPQRPTEKTPAFIDSMTEVKDKAVRILGEVEKELKATHKYWIIHKSEPQGVSSLLGKKMELCPCMPMTLEDSIKAYYAMRKLVAGKCKAEKLSCSKYSMHMHFSIGDAKGNNLLDADKRSHLTDAVGENSLEALDKHLPLLATKQFMQTPAKSNSTGTYQHAQIGTDKRSMIRLLRDNDYYDGMENCEHFELRRTLPGADCKPEFGFDGFSAALAVVAGSSAMAMAGRKASPVAPDVTATPYETRMASLRTDPLVQDILGDKIQATVLNEEISAEKIRKTKKAPEKSIAG